MLQKKEKYDKRYSSTEPLKFRMATLLENQKFDDSSFQHHLPQIYRTFLKSFRKIAQGSVFFHFFFIGLIIGETLFFSLATTTPAIAAMLLGALFLTGFSYLVVHFYYQARKPEKLLDLRQMFLESCRRHIPIPSGELQHHLTIAAALLKLASYLEDFEKNFYELSPRFSFLNSFSSYFYWKDVFNLKRLLLTAAIEEHLKQIRSTPTDLEVHASLATTYVAQSKIYRPHHVFEKQFRSAARLAVEEFRILNHYAPNDPWVHEQLAEGYRELEMPEEELREVELLLKLKPLDKEILFRLGTLYFHQGMNAKGLQTYEELKKSNFKAAETLIASYGSLSD
jgi:tetratricopeptide (TPR) repeat protein